MSTPELAARLDRIESELAIRRLVARYCFSIDDRDLQTVGSLFLGDAVFRSQDGHMNAKGRDAIVKQFEGRFSQIGPSYHSMHQHLIEIVAGRPDEATGLVAGHAEFFRNGKPTITATRHADRYRREDGRWYFTERVVSFMYFTPIDAYAAAMGSRNRIIAGEEPRAADWPESAPTWIDYRAA